MATPDPPRVVLSPEVKRRAREALARSLRRRYPGQLVRIIPEPELDPPTETGSPISPADAAPLPAQTSRSALATASSSAARPVAHWPAIRSNIPSAAKPPSARTSSAIL